jgi:uncharacterized repeat protein (TIGR03847 family)
MNYDIEFDPADRITVGTVGPPGERTFMIQASRGSEEVSLVIEKTDALAFGEATRPIMSAYGFPQEKVDEGALEFHEDAVPAWRVGSIEVAYSEERDLLLITCQELVDEDQEGSTAKFWVSRAQILAMATQAAMVAAQGRPLCPLCGKPMEEGEEHRCFAVNGHKR